MSLTKEEIQACTIVALDQPPFIPIEKDNVFAFTVKEEYPKKQSEKLVTDEQLSNILS